MSDKAVASAPHVAARLVVWSEDPAASAPCVAALKQGFALEERQSLTEIGAVMTDDPDCSIMLFYRSPADLLSAAMDSEVAPGAALAEWQGRAQQILRLNRRNRRQVRLLDIDMALAHPQAFRQQFHLPEGAVPESAAQEARDEVLLLMAQRILVGDAATRRLLSELTAASLDLAGQGGQPIGDLDAAFRAYQELRRSGREKLEVADKDLRQARRDIEMLQAQANAAQEEMETLTTRRLELEAELESARAQGRHAELLRRQAELLQEEREALLSDRERLEQRLEQIGQGMESFQVQVAELSAERERFLKRLAEKDHSFAAAAAALQDLEQQLRLMRVDRDEALQLATAIRRSKSFRMMAPLRRLRAVLSGRGRA